ncbi:MAG: bifunctional UDP-N-acetylglucosamine pyrophosphorylase/glucosamine-1-phosphate N-acetyltransferase [Cellvibrionaceae bacterium]|jgi:bifunctional UDP-N-acetylglucosamine pyrophosphorylase/glucosamine-1-phosphate N-acetyltransferase
MLDIIVLAAGRGTRMKSDLPKVLHPIAGRPMLVHVLDALEPFRDRAIHLVVGHGSELLKKTLGDDPPINFIEQQQQLGTGHAVQQVISALETAETVLILYGDVPLIQTHTLEQLVQKVNKSALSLLTVTLDNPNGYGRIIRDSKGSVKAIAEQKDASDEQRKIREVNTGIMAVNGRQLKRWLPQLNNNNAQGEYYLTDIIALAVAEGVHIECSQPLYEWEVLGVNNRSQQAQLERIYQLQLADQLMSDGVTLMDPQRFDCRGQLSCGSDTYIDVNCVFEGNNYLGNQVIIGPNCLLKNARIGDNTTIAANSIIEGTDIGRDCHIGPFARLRPGTQLADRARVGNFVETKKAIIGADSKINHLSYVGDAVLGKGVNIGAGTITCNYDGANKHQTTIGDDVFIGSNTALVAPVAVKNSATIGAGSTITNDVESDQLSLTRAPQKTFSGWKRPQQKK